MTTSKPYHPIARNLTRAVFILLALLPFLFGSIAAISNFSDYGRNKLISILPYALFFTLLAAVLRAPAPKMQEIYVLIFVFAAAVLIRALSQIFFNTQPISDYMDAVNAGVAFLDGPTRSVETARFPYWGFYRVTLSALFRLTGSTIRAYKMLNLFLSGLTAVSVYLLGRETTDSRRFGMTASLMFIIDPAHILYINMPTGEHIFIFLLPIAVLLFLKISGGPEKKAPERIALALVLGMLIGLMEMVKPVARILLIAMPIALLLTNYLPATKDGVKNARRKQRLLHLLLIAAVLMAFIGTKEAGLALVGHYARIPPNRWGTGWTLRVGLNMDNNGRVSSDLAYYMHTLYHASDEDYRAVNAQLTDEALARMQGVHFGEILRFVKEKFVFTWQSNQDFYNWATNTQMDGGLLPAYDAEGLRLLGDPINDAYLVFSLILSAIGAVYCAFKRSDEGTLVIGLFILGFTLLLLVAEVQQRYRSVLASSIPFFMAYGLYAVNYVLSLNKKPLQ